MTPFTRPYRTTQCRVCGNLVPAANLTEHLMADARILRVIKATRPEWDRQQCEDYLKSLAGPKAGMRASPREELSSPAPLSAEEG